jgi:hypothetical protein
LTTCGEGCFISNILGVTVSDLPVVINGFGQLGTMTSSRRFKHDIKPMEKTSASILALKPVTFLELESAIWGARAAVRQTTPVTRPRTSDTSQIKKVCSFCEQDYVFRQFAAGNYML